MSVIASALDDEVPPSCPASPAATLRFASLEWSVSIDATRWEPALERRERAVRALRAAGDPRAADAVGWLSLAGVLMGFPLSLVRRITSAFDPTVLASDVATAAEPGIGPIRQAEEVGPGHYDLGGGLVIVDAGSRPGWATAELAARVAVGAIVVVGGAPLAPAAARRLLRRRFDDALVRQGSR